MFDFAAPDAEAEEAATDPVSSPDSEGSSEVREDA